MPRKNTVKVAYDFDVGLKRQLAVLKADLRLRGFPASETGILEALIKGADVSSLMRLLRRQRR